MTTEDGVGPFEFLFCEKCNRHVERYMLDYKDLKAVKVGDLSDEDRKKRVAPTIHFKVLPRCVDCNMQLIQKYVTVKGTINMNEGEKK